MGSDVNARRGGARAAAPRNGAQASAPGSQTLSRGLDVLDAVAGGTVDLAALSSALGTTRSTTHRLASALVERRYLNFVPREGYSLGPRLLELGFKAQQAMQIPKVARAHLERLSETCEDTVHLGVLDGDWALYLDKIPGRRRIEISSRVGERHPVWSTGLGRALILDMGEERWRRFFEVGAATSGTPVARDAEAWLTRMRVYAERGVAFDLEDNEPQVRCIAAPIRDTTGRIAAAFSVTSTTRYMDEVRMDRLSDSVLNVAHAISRALGWSPSSPPPRSPSP